MDTAFSVRKRSLSHHGQCWEGSVPSGSRSRRTTSWKWVHRPQVEINYSKLKELCTHRILSQEDTRSKHNQFMAEYSSIFQKKAARQSRESKTRQIHSCTGTLQLPTLHSISDVMVAIHGREKEEQQAIDLEARLKIMLKIAKKLPIQRSSSEVKQLAQLIAYFPSLLPSESTDLEVLTGVAARAQIEITDKGFSSIFVTAVPNQGGSYIILQGSVEKLTKESETVATKISSEILNAGETFGEMKEQRGPAKLSYPIYTTKEPSALMRITAFNYQKVVESCKSTKAEEKQQVLGNCSLLHHTSPSVLAKLAAAITWETVPANTVVLREGQVIQKIGFIQRGKCVAYANVPRLTRKAQVYIGELVPGGCIGEVFLRGNAKQPYTITTTTDTRIGWVTDNVIRVNEVEKHILTDKPLALKTLTEDEIRNKYADNIMKRHWDKIRDEIRNKYADNIMKRHWDKIRHDIMSEVITEKGIRLGSGRYRHSRSYSEGERPQTSLTARNTLQIHSHHIK